MAENSGIPPVAEPKGPEDITDAMESMLFPGEVEEAPEPDEVEASPDGAEEATEEATSEGSDDADPVVEIEHLGKKYKVNESFAKAFEANRAQATRVSMEAAELRKATVVERQALEAEAQFRQHASAEFEALQQVEAQIAQYRNVDWTQLDTDQIMRARMALDNLKDKREEAQRKINGLEQQFKTLREQNIGNLRNQAKEYLNKALPGGFNEDVDRLLAQQAISEGFAPEEALQILDPRALKMLWKAAQWDRVQQSKQSVLKRAQGAPPVARQGAVDPNVSRKMQDLNFRKQLKAEKSPYRKADLIQGKLERLFG